MKHNFNYIIRIQYLGFRYRGWFWQQNVKTVQDMVQKTLLFVFRHDKFKTLGAGRTDAMVSSNDYSFQLFMSQPIADFEEFMVDFNLNLPSDIRALDIKEVDQEFNIMLDNKVKEYVYLFSFGEKFHPFSAPYMAFQKANLDIELMKEGAKLFEGTHHFGKYCSQPSPNAIFERTIEFCEIKDNDLYTANFFPKNSYMMTIRSAGFMRYQIRFIMSALFKLGRREIELQDIIESLKESDNREHLEHPAPASGLILNKLTYDEFN